MLKKFSISQWIGVKRNWPDLRRDCDPSRSFRFPVALFERNWPDLRRDCDDSPPGLCPHQNTGKKLTWFTKGLRLRGCWMVARVRGCWKKLTWFTKGLRLSSSFFPSSLDFVKKLTWFTKGLRRQVSVCPIQSEPCQKKLTWFTKGLRHRRFVTPSHHWVRERNWPDLRRDCDARLLPVSYRPCPWKKLTWFTKGLRHLLAPSITIPFSPKKLTWFTKGLRLTVKPRLYKRFR